jgi:hypothetical protein
VAFPPKAAICWKYVELLEQYVAATEGYFETVKNLQNSSNDTEIFSTYELATVARKRCVAARDALQNHRQSHRCRISRHTSRGAPSAAQKS